MTLPPCPARRLLESESGVFYCAHPRVHALEQRVTAEVCSICSRWREPPPETFRPFPPPPPRGVCVHLGTEIGLRDCPGCRGLVRIKVFACGHPAHRETTLGECVSCSDHQERSN